MEGKSSVETEPFSKTEEIAEIFKKENQYDSQPREKSTDNKEDEQKPKLKLGTGSLQFNSETEETVALKPIPTTQTFETDGKDQKEYDDAVPLNVNSTKPKSQRSTENDEFIPPLEAANEALSDVESKKEHYQKILKITEKTKDYDRKIQKSKCSLEDDKPDFENVTLRPVPEITVLQNVDDQHTQETFVQLSTSPTQLHSRTPDYEREDLKADVVITEDVTHELDNEIVTNHEKEESTIPVDESSLDPVAVKSVIKSSSDQETSNKEIDPDISSAVFKRRSANI